MNAPKWFWAVLAVCVVALTATAVWRQRYVVHEAAVMDLWKMRYCAPDTCVRVGWAPTKSPLDSLIRANLTAH